MIGFESKSQNGSAIVCVLFFPGQSEDPKALLYVPFYCWHKAV